MIFNNGGNVRRIERIPTDPGQTGYADNSEIRELRREAERLEKLKKHRATSSKSGCVLDHTSRRLETWDSIVGFALVFTAFVTPFEISFLDMRFDALFVLNRCCDMVFLTDLVVCFLRPVYDDTESRWILSHREIARRYIRGWFPLDVLSILPYDSIGMLFSSDALESLRFLRILRLMRMVKLARVFKVNRLVKRFEANAAINYGVMSLLKFGVMVMMTAHWSACVFHLVPVLFESNPSWITEGGFVDASVGERYTAALYWSVMTITTIGYGDVSNASSPGRAVSVALMLIGASLFAYVIGSVCGIVSNLTQVSTSFHSTMDHLNSLIKEQEIPECMSVRLRAYFVRCQRLHRQKFFVGVMQQMSPGLKGEFAVYTQSEWVEHIPFFVAAPEREREPFITAITLAMGVRAYPGRETIIHTGEYTERLYVIQSGLVARLGRLLSRGKFFGEDMILHNARRRYCCRSLTFTVAHTLCKADLEAVLAGGDFPHTQRAIRRAAIKLALRREFVQYARTVKAREQEEEMRALYPDTAAAAAAGASPRSVRSHANARLVDKRRLLSGGGGGGGSNLTRSQSTPSRNLARLSRRSRKIAPAPAPALSPSPAPAPSAAATASTSSHGGALLSAPTPSYSSPKASSLRGPASPNAASAAAAAAAAAGGAAAAGPGGGVGVGAAAAVVGAVGASHSVAADGSTGRLLGPPAPMLPAAAAAAASAATAATATAAAAAVVEAEAESPGLAMVLQNPFSDGPPHTATAVATATAAADLPLPAPQQRNGTSSVSTSSAAIAAASPQLTAATAAAASPTLSAAAAPPASATEMRPLALPAAAVATSTSALASAAAATASGARGGDMHTQQQPQQQQQPELATATAFVCSRLCDAIAARAAAAEASLDGKCGSVDRSLARLLLLVEGAQRRAQQRNQRLNTVLMRCFGATMVLLLASAVLLLLRLP